MKLSIRIAGTIIFLVFAAPLSAVQSGDINFRAALRTAPYTSGELIVKFRQHGAAKSVHRSVGGTLKASMRMLKSDLVRLPEGMSLKDAMRHYQNDPNVEYAEPNYRVRKASVPNDPRFGEQWNMLRISAPQAWDISTGSSAANATIVAVLDTGIDYNHPDLAANMWVNPGEIASNGADDDGNGIVDDYYGANFNSNLPPSGNPMDDDSADSHGTHVAGIIGAVGNNGIGVAGLNWNARIMAVKFLHGPEGIGELADALKGIEYALSKGAKIINCSFEVSEDPSLTAGIQSLRDAVQLAETGGALVVSAAGNRHANLDLEQVYPASIRLPNNIAVTVSGSNDQLPYYADYGKSVIDVAAPGGNASNSPTGVLSTVSLRDFAGAILQYRTTAGTSMAAPHVSGLALLIWNMNPGLSHYQVKARILNSVDKIACLTGTTITGGRINAFRALTIGDLPAVFNVTPARTMPGSTVVITGVNFGTGSGNPTIGGVPMTVASWSDTAISAIVPSSAFSGEVMINGFGSGFPLTIPETPGVTLTGTPLSGAPSLPVVFTAEPRGAETRVVSYEWNFGDGAFRPIDGVTSTATHTFDAAGTFAVQVRITDDLGRSSVGETRVSVGTAPKGGEGCFIATAAWGSELHPRVVALRRFRDQYLMTNLPGRLFVKGYYAVSPPLADFIAEHERLRMFVRWGLAPLVVVAERL